MYFDASQYSAGVASPLWPQDVMQQQWYQTHSQTNFESYHDPWNEQQMSYNRFDRSHYDNYVEDYRIYNLSQYGSYPVLDNQLANVFSQLANISDEPDEVLVVNSSSSGAYSSLCADAKIADLVAFDAEWAPDHTYGSDNPISVLQLAFPLSRRAYVIQLDRISGRLPNEVQMMLDRAKMARSGIAVTKGSVIDVQEFCGAALGLNGGGKSLSLKNAALGLLGYQLLKDKRLSCSDWAKSELTPQQVRYAALDAWVPLRLCYSLL